MIIRNNKIPNWDLTASYDREKRGGVRYLCTLLLKAIVKGIEQALLLKKPEWESY